MPGEADQATDGDLESSGERLADQVGATPPEDDESPGVAVPPAPD